MDTKYNQNQGWTNPATYYQQNIKWTHISLQNFNFE